MLYEVLKMHHHKNVRLELWYTQPVSQSGPVMSTSHALADTSMPAVQCDECRVMIVHWLHIE